MVQLRVSLNHFQGILRWFTSWPKYVVTIQIHEHVFIFLLFFAALTILNLSPSADNKTKTEKGRI